MTHVLHFSQPVHAGDTLVVDVRCVPVSTSTLVTGGGYDGVSTIPMTLCRLDDGAHVWVASRLLRELP